MVRIKPRTRGDVIGGDLGPNRKDVQRAELFGGHTGLL